MIAHDESLVAYLGGPAGETLYLAEPGGTFREAVRYGLEKKEQAARQRRLLLTPDCLFVLEPKEGVFFDEGDVRVRRLDRDGRELDVVEGRGDEGPAQMALLAVQDGRDAPLQVTAFGVDPETGLPWRWHREEEPQFRWRPWGRRSRPLWVGDTLYAPFHGKALRIYRAGVRETADILCGMVQRLRDRVLVVGYKDDRPAVWLDGAIRPVSGPPIFPYMREFRGAPAVERADGSLVLLRSEGGALPGLDGPGGTLPAGLYDGFVAVGGEVWGLEIANGPRMVRAEL
ncbi:MAG: hypothetical protein AAGD14_15695 [Planctomycetota bacterium]